MNSALVGAKDNFNTEKALGTEPNFVKYIEDLNNSALFTNSYAFKYKLFLVFGLLLV